MLHSAKPAWVSFGCVGDVNAAMESWETVGGPAATAEALRIVMEDAL